MAKILIPKLSARANKILSDSPLFDPQDKISETVLKDRILYWGYWPIRRDIGCGPKTANELIEWAKNQSTC